MSVRVILAVDRPGWSFYNIASKIVNYFNAKYKEQFLFNIAIGSTLRNEEADLVVAFKWNQLPGIMKNNKIKRSILCLYDHVTWNLTSQDEFAFKHAVRKADFIAAGNQMIIENLRVRDLDTVPVFLVEDGVSVNEFKPIALPAQFTVGWCGNAAHGFGSIKGLELIQEACDMTRTPLVISDTSGNKVIPLHAMPAWYERISCYVCASTAEGTPNPVLEAMACGRPVITTRVGLTERLVVDGINGFFVDRTADSIANAIDEVKSGGRCAEMGHAARLAAESYDWSFKMFNWRLLLEAAALTI